MQMIAKYSVHHVHSFRYIRCSVQYKFLTIQVLPTHNARAFLTKKPLTRDPGKTSGFDHGVGHPLLFLCDAKVPDYRKNKGFKDLGYYSEWPKVTDAVIKAK
jgi:hypothetical protein